MTRILNARLPNGNYGTIEIQNSQIYRIVTQDLGIITKVAGVKKLTEVALQGRLLSSMDQIDAQGEWIFPAAIDAHIHSRSPGLEAKEDWETVGKCAAKGGVAAVVDMPNTIPPTLYREQALQKAALAEKSGVDFRILMGVSAKNIETLAPVLEDLSLPVCGVKVFYGPSTGDLVYSDLVKLGQCIPKRGNRLIVFHSEDQCGIDCNKAELGGEYEQVRDRTDKASYSIHSRLRSSSTAWTATQEILKWAETYNGPVHIAHVSTPKEVEMILGARKRGAQVTCEVAPHHILLSTADYPKLGGFLKVNPPVRSPEEVKELRGHLAAGNIDMIATDHAPHLKEEKIRPYDQCPSGMPSLDFFYPLAMEMARVSGLSMEKAVNLVTEAPARVFGFPGLAGFKPGCEASFVWYRAVPTQVSEKEVVSKCGWSPYDGMMLPGKVLATWRNGRCLYSDVGSQAGG